MTTLLALTTEEFIRISIGILLLFIMLVIYLRRIDKPKLFLEFSRKNDFLLKGSTHVVLSADGLNCEIVLENPNSNKYERLIMLAHASRETAFEFTLRWSSVWTQFDTLINVEKLETGDPEFDETFILSTNNEELCLRLFDEHLRNDFISNKEYFRNGLRFNDSCLHLFPNSRVKTADELEQLKEIALFMLHVVHQLEAKSELVGKLRPR